MPRILASLGLAIATFTTCTIAEAECSWFCGDYTRTKYPIVLVHGSFGFSNIGPVGSFYRIEDGLKSGGAKVYVPSLSPANTAEVRGEQLLKEVQDIIALTGIPKVNLIGHSWGGPTARYVSGVAPQLVASVTSVAGPNKGKDSPPSSDFAIAVSNAIATLIALAGNAPLNQDRRAEEQSFSVAAMAAFNARFPGGVPDTDCGEGAAVASGIRYYSWSGDATSTSQITNIFDPADYLLAIASGEFKGVANDGIVVACGSHLGVVIRDNYFQNHFDEINHVFGLVSPFTANPISLFREQANRLKNVGL